MAGFLLAAVLALLSLNGLRLLGSDRMSDAGMFRGLLFLTICVPLRAMIALRSKDLPASLFAAISAGFLYTSAFGRDTGFFGGEVWWPRPLHALAYGVAAGARLNGSDPTGVLLLDVIIGLVFRILRV